MQWQILLRYWKTKRQFFQRHKSSRIPNIKLNQKGQLVVEYVLLLLIAVTIAFVLRKGLVQKGEDVSDSGAILQKWQMIGDAISADDPNKRKK